MALFLKFKLQYPFKYENGTETPEREEQWISFIRNSHTGFRTHSFSTSKFKYEKIPNASHLSPAKTPLPAKKGKISFVFVDVTEGFDWVVGFVTHEATTTQNKQVIIENFMVFFL